MKTITALLLIIICVLSSITTSIAEVADDKELNVALRVISVDLAQTNAIALNCNDEDALADVAKWRNRAYRRLAREDFGERALNKFEDRMDDDMRNEKSMLGSRCNQNFLRRLVKALEVDYNYLDDVLNRYIPLNRN